MDRARPADILQVIKFPILPAKEASTSMMAAVTREAILAAVARITPVAAGTQCFTAGFADRCMQIIGPTLYPPHEA